jgi:hypothetical protein
VTASSCHLLDLHALFQCSSLCLEADGLVPDRDLIVNTSEFGFFSFAIATNFPRGGLSRGAVVMPSNDGLASIECTLFIQ